VSQCQDPDGQEASVATAYERHQEFLESDLRARLLELDAASANFKTDWIGLAVDMRGHTLFDMAPGLAQFERDVRRAAGQVIPRNWVTVRRPDNTWYKGPPPGKLPTPISPSQGGLRPAEAAVGSLDLWLELFGDVYRAFSSQPATTLVNAIQIMGLLAHIRVFKRRRRPSQVADPLEGVSARQALSVLKEFGYEPRDLLQTDDEPDDEDWVGESPAGHRMPRGYVRLPDGTVVRGQRILLVKQYTDGTFDMVHVDG
jgi:hypothetical protein